MLRKIIILTILPLLLTACSWQGAIDNCFNNGTAGPFLVYRGL